MRALLLLLLLTACAEHEAGAPRTSLEDVDAAVLAAYQQYGDRHILLIGDSLTMYNPVSELCGWPVIKAGYSGAKWATVASRPIWAQMRSRIVVVMLGTNNAIKGPPVDQQEMHAFVDRLPGQVLVETTPPFFDPFYISPDTLGYLDTIQTNQLALGYQVIDNRQAMNNALLYTDGIHWNEAGYAVQTALLEQEVCGWVN